MSDWNYKSRATPLAGNAREVAFSYDSPLRNGGGRVLIRHLRDGMVELQIEHTESIKFPRDKRARRANVGIVMRAEEWQHLTQLPPAPVPIESTEAPSSASKRKQPTW